MKKITLLFSLLLTVSLMSYSQIYVDNKGNVYDNRKKETTTQQSATTTNSNTSSEGGFDRSKLSLGGIFGLQLGSNTFINVMYFNELRYNFESKSQLGIVWVGTTNVNEELLKAGLAWRYKYNKSDHYLKLENQAKEKKINIWSMNNPVNPSDFHSQKRNKKAS